MSKAVIFFARGLEECEGLLCAVLPRRMENSPRHRSRFSALRKWSPASAIVPVRLSDTVNDSDIHAPLSAVAVELMI